MADLATVLQSLVSLPVVDRTGLTGTYDIDLKFAPTDLKANDDTTPDSDGDPSIFAALPQQLGLKLVARKEKADVFVVDRISRPTAN